MTFSLIARTPDARCFGMVIASSSPAVAARCAHARAGAGVVATQNITDPSLGPRILDSLARRMAAPDALAAALDGYEFAAYRQVMALGQSHSPAIHSGAYALGTVGAAAGLHAAAAGNLLATADVPAVMLRAFDTARGPFDRRLLDALQAGLARGGEAGPIHSAGILVVRDVSWPIVDLRVDWCETDPIGELERVWAVYSPQIDSYVQRAVDPRLAPGFGVPGDPSGPDHRTPQR